MAGLCTGHGLSINSEGKVFLDGAREVAWPYTECDLDANNGLRFDSATDKAWVTPPTKLSTEVATAAARNVVPTTTGVKALRDVHLEHTTLKCGNGWVRVDVAGGYSGFRLANGNFWLLKRYVTLSVNGAPVTFTGLELIGACENNSGGVLSQGTTVESTVINWELPPGALVEVDVHWELDVASYSAGALNQFTFRPPPVIATFYTQP